MNKCLAFGPILLLAACRPSASEIPDNNVPQAEATAYVPEKATTPAIEAAVDETSPRAAAKLVERYGDLLERRRFGDALRLWGDNGPGEAEFIAGFEIYATIRAGVGAPGEPEGAAGSIYIDVPLTLSGTLKSGGHFKLAGPTTLRRANNVPGSTAEQRRWHIYASRLEPAG